MTSELKIHLGTGVLTWDRAERVTDRYGTVWLMEDGHTSQTGGEPKRLLDLDAVKLHVGKTGALVASVIDPRKSTHIGDLFRGIFPSTPDLWERIVLGRGELFLDDEAVGLRPAVYRNRDWLDPHALYRAHEQLVRLTFEPEGGAA